MYKGMACSIYFIVHDYCVCHHLKVATLSIITECKITVYKYSQNSILTHGIYTDLLCVHIFELLDR